jgi:hypothetical protein
MVEVTDFEPASYPVIETPDSSSSSTSYSSCELLTSTSAVGICVPTDTVSLSFCGEFVDYSNVCIPPGNSIWSSWNGTSKDSLLKTEYTSIVNARIELETETVSSTEDSTIAIRFTNNKKCQNSYKRALCMVNFPRCGNSKLYSDGVYNSTTYPVCSSVCSTYLDNCRFDSTTACPIWPMNETAATSSECTSDAVMGRSVFIGLMGVFLLFLIH